MKLSLRIWTFRALVCLLLTTAFSAAISAQDPRKEKLMRYYIDGKDTIYVEELPPAYTVGKKKGKEWRKFYRLVHNFAKTYPYALLAREKVMEADSTIEYEKMNRREKVRYVNRFQDQLFSAFEKPLRNLTVTQGKLLLRLIDREIGVTPYEIIKNYKNKAAAGFWQGIARLFGSDMKKPYDPEGEDRSTEELVKIYQIGEFNLLYRSIFGKNPPEPAARAKKDYRQY